MREIKFACPGCGQHITTDASTIGGRIECPTCFRTLVVPERASSPESKLVFAAPSTPTPRPYSQPDVSAKPSPPSSTAQRLTRIIWITGLCTAAGVLIFFHDNLIGATKAKWREWRSVTKPPRAGPQPLAGTAAKAGSGWTLDSSLALFPDEDVRGRVHGRPFRPGHATLHAGRLGFRQGDDWPPQLGLSVHLFSQNPADLAGKTIEISSDRNPPLPEIVLRWIDEDGRPETEHIKSGYVLRIVFERPVQGRIQGKFYIALPDALKSYAAGDFDAEIIKPSKPNPTAPGVGGTNAAVGSP